MGQNLVSVDIPIGKYDKGDTDDGKSISAKETADDGIPVKTERRT